MEHKYIKEQIKKFKDEDEKIQQQMKEINTKIEKEKKKSKKKIFFINNNINILYLLDIYEHIIRHKLFQRDVVSMEVPRYYTGTGNSAESIYLFYSHHNIGDHNESINISYDTYLSNHYLTNLDNKIEYFRKEIRDKAEKILEEYNKSKKEEVNKIRKRYDTRDDEIAESNKKRKIEIDSCVICGDEKNLQDYMGKIGQKYKICEDCVKNPELKNMNLDGKRKFLRKFKRKSLRKSLRKSTRKSPRKSTRKSPRKSKRKSLRKSKRKSPRKSKRKSPRKSLRKSLRKSKRKKNKYLIRFIKK
jgi:hypothetical protein